VWDEQQQLQQLQQQLHDEDDDKASTTRLWRWHTALRVGADLTNVTAGTTTCESSTTTTSSTDTTSSTTNTNNTTPPTMMDHARRRWSALGRHATVRKMQDHAAHASLHSKYKVRWRDVLGEGSFGAVFGATHRATGEAVALKKIPKRYTDDVAFQKEMNALLHLRMAGGHPHICSLHEHFDQDGCYYVVLDLIRGGELFEHLVRQGAFSEQDAARLVREVASALTFVHGLDTVHGDLKPENLMLSTDNPSDAVIKVVDFGCAQVTAPDSPFSESPADILAHQNTGRTPAYCPPEVLDKTSAYYGAPLEPSMDMWGLGVILYIMLTGLHPFDLTGKATDDEIERDVVAGKEPPLKNSPITAHLSESAIHLMERLMAPDPKQRITALEMLSHPWVKGETARSDKIADSDKRLSMYRVFKSRLEAQVFADIVNWSDMTDTDDNSRKASLIERSFRSFDPQRKGYITEKDLRKLTKDPDAPARGTGQLEPVQMSLSGFSDLLAENMKNKYFPKGHVVYHEGDIGNHMYFINSGTIDVVTNDGSQVSRGPGNFFGEGALLHPKKIRSATIQCSTPVHAMEISREYFEKYLATSDSALLLTLKEKDKVRKRNRTKQILRSQKNLVDKEFQLGEVLFASGEKGDSLFLVEDGLVDIFVGGKKVLTATPGNLCGEHSVLTGRCRNSTAVCATKDGCKVQQMAGRDFRKLVDASPDMKASLRDLCVRRDFKKAVVFRLKKEFPYDNPREAFDAVRTENGRDDGLDAEAVGLLMRDMNPGCSDDEILELIRILDMNGSGKVTFEEFKKVFISDIRTAAAM
jgi:serine/threonine protein kinase